MIEHRIVFPRRSCQDQATAPDATRLLAPGRWTRLLGGATILGVLIWRIGTGPFLDGLRSLSAAPLIAAAAIVRATARQLVSGHDFFSAPRLAPRYFVAGTTNRSLSCESIIHARPPSLAEP